jgi:hypothetical protein
MKNFISRKTKQVLNKQKIIGYSSSEDNSKNCDKNGDNPVSEGNTRTSTV